MYIIALIPRYYTLIGLVPEITPTFHTTQHAHFDPYTCVSMPAWINYFKSMLSVEYSC